MHTLASTDPRVQSCLGATKNKVTAGALLATHAAGAGTGMQQIWNISTIRNMGYVEEKLEALKQHERYTRVYSRCVWICHAKCLHIYIYTYIFLVYLLRWFQHAWLSPNAPWHHLILDQPTSENSRDMLAQAVCTLPLRTGRHPNSNHVVSL